MSDIEKKQESHSALENVALDNAAQDWLPDAEPTPQLLNEASPLVIQTTEAVDATAAAVAEHIAFITDPYGFGVLEVRDAQNAPEDADLVDGDENENENEAESAFETEDGEKDEDPIEPQDPEKVAAELDRLASALEQQEKENQLELEAATAAQEVEAAATLAQQIAEDIALEQQLQAEAEAEEEIDPELAAALPKAPVANENGELDLTEMESCIEALLFMSDKPLSESKLQELLGAEINLSLFKQALDTLTTRYSSAHHGFELVQVAGGYQLRTKAGRAALAKKLAKVTVQRLSAGAMETLAIVAYRQPVLKDDIDKIRGVDSSHFIRGLMDKKLIKITGRSELPGRPMLYSTTQEFLELFGLSELSALPSLRELEQMVPNSQSKNPDEASEDPRVREMRRLVGEMKADTSTSLIYDPKEDEQFLKEIRERVNAIPTSTPYVEQQKEAERLAAEALKAAQNPAPAIVVPAGLEGLVAEAQP